MQPATSVHFTAQYRLVKKLGSGAFGEVYLGADSTTGAAVAVKFEKQSSARSLLQREHVLYTLLKGRPGVPKLYTFTCDREYNILVIDLLGPSLEELFVACGRRLSLKCVLMVADQLLSRLETLHNSGYTHRDVKPENFLIGIGRQKHVIFMTDFGLAQRYIDVETKRHIPYRDGKRLTGTARFASIHAHSGCEQSRRDDLESLAYSLIYFLRGSLPWQNLHAPTTEEKLRRILHCKETTSPDELCEGLPCEFANYLRYCRSLDFEETPNYPQVKRQFRELFQREGFDYDFVYDWDFEVPGEEQAEEEKSL
jgi:serine/threonine protein kinase